MIFTCGGSDLSWEVVSIPGLELLQSGKIGSTDTLVVGGVGGFCRNDLE